MRSPRTAAKSSPPLATTRESPQRSQKLKKKKENLPGLNLEPNLLSIPNIKCSGKAKKGTIILLPADWLRFHRETSFELGLKESGFPWPEAGRRYWGWGNCPARWESTWHVLETLYKFGWLEYRNAQGRANLLGSDCQGLKRQGTTGTILPDGPAAMAQIKGFGLQ